MPRFRPLIATAFALLSAAGCSGSAATSPMAVASPGTAAPASSSALLEKVTVGKPARKTLTLYSPQPAVIEPFEQTPLYSRVAGYVERVHVDIGDRVKQDQPLVKLWIPELSDDRAAKEALVAQALAELEQARAGVAAAEAAVKTAAAQHAGTQAGIVRAKGELDRWKAESDRINKLVASGVVTDKLGDETRNQLRSAEASQAEAAAQVQSVEAMVEEAQARVRKAVADEAAAAAQVKVAEAELARAVTLEQYTEIKAPYDGIITARNVDTRHAVQPSGGMSQPLLVIASCDTVRVTTSIPETEAPLVTSGTDDADPVVISLQAIPHRTWVGKVTRTSWTLDPQNRSLTVEIELANADGALRPGMYATAQVRLAEAQDVLTLPAAAIVRDGGSTLCCVVANGTITRRPVQLGLRVGDEIEVVSGATETDSVVLARAGNLKEGQAVEVLPPPPPPK